MSSTTSTPYSDVKWLYSTFSSFFFSNFYFKLSSRWLRNDNKTHLQHVVANCLRLKAAVLNWHFWLCVTEALVKNRNTHCKLSLKRQHFAYTLKSCLLHRLEWWKRGYNWPSCNNNSCHVSPFTIGCIPSSFVPLFPSLPCCLLSFNKVNRQSETLTDRVKWEGGANLI